MRGLPAYPRLRPLPEETRRELAAAYRAHLADLKKYWASVDIEAHDPGQIAGLEPGAIEHCAGTAGTLLCVGCFGGSCLGTAGTIGSFGCFDCTSGPSPDPDPDPDPPDPDPDPPDPDPDPPDPDPDPPDPDPDPDDPDDDGDDTGGDTGPSSGGTSSPGTIVG